MTKEDFKKKYHGQAIIITCLMSLGSFNAGKEVAEKTNQLRNICDEMGLKVTDLPEMFDAGLPKKTLVIVDPDKPQKEYNGVTNVSISIAEFLEDFAHYVKEEEEKGVTKVLDILRGMKINNVDIKHIGASQNMKRLAVLGFIQGYTSNEASLWWNPKGRRLLFVRGEGVFILTDKTEDNA